MNVEPPTLRLALEELAAAVRDAKLRYRAGDDHALDSHLLSATLAQAERVLDELDEADE